MLRLVRSWMRTVSFVQLVAPLALVAGCGALAAFGQLPMPKLTSLSPPGGKVGSEIELKITGGELENADRLMFSHPGITATLKMEAAGDFSRQPRPVPNTFAVKIAGDVPPGLYEVRAICHFGMSNPRTFQVGSLEEISKTGGISSRDKAQAVAVGSVVSGQAEGDSVDYYKLTATAGQRLLVDCFAQRIDSRMDPALVLYDATGRELRRVTGSYGSDPVLEINAQAAGDYIVGVHDFTYNGGPERFYRLAIHTGPHIDFVFPPVGQAGTSSKYTIYGRNLPGGQPVDKMNVDGSQLQQVAVDIALPGDAAAQQKLTPASSMKPFQATVDSLVYQLNSPQGASNPVAIGYATAPLAVEAEPNNDSAQPQMVNVPCEFVGQFYPRGDLDWVQFAAQKDEVFWLEVVSHRLGLPTDPIIVVERVSQNDKGEAVVTPIVTNDDMAEGRPRDNNQPQMFSISNRDPRISFTAGEAGNYRVGVRDLYGDSRGDPRMVYRLAIRKAQPDFQVLVFSGVTPAENNNQLELTGLTLRRGQASKLTVAVDRRDGFAGEVQVVAEGLPPGVTCTGAIVGGKATDAALVVQAAADAPAAAATFRIIGKAKINDQEVTREARHGALTWGAANQEEMPVARITRDIAISVIEKETAPATATAGAGTPIETSLGATIKVPIKVARHNGFAAALKFRAEDVPQNIQAKETDVAGADGEMEIALNRNDIQPGTYTFNLSGQTKIKYTRNPEGLKAAEDRFKELDEILKEFTEKVKQAGDAARQAQEQANQKKDDQALADAAKAADANAKALEEKRKQAENLRRQFEQELNQTRERSKERDLNYWVITSPVTLRIAPTPITVAAQSPCNKKQGEKFQIPVTIERKYGFDDVVEVTLEAPGGVSGISAPQLKLEKGQNQGNLEVTFNENATAGMHTFILRGRVRYNNVQLDQTLPLALAVDPK
jgi:hypothetical protein